MTHKKIRLAPKKQAWANQFKPDVLRGAPLRPSLSTGTQYQGEVLRLVEMMTRETHRELMRLFTSPVFDADEDLTARIMREETGELPYAVAMDASIASQARIVMNRLQDRFRVLFNRAATDATRRMVERSLANSASELKTSLKDLSGQVSLKTDILTGELNDTVIASTAYAVNLFKRIPADYLAGVSDDVLRSITTGNGLQDLIPAIEKHGIQIRNYAKNTALDQTRKVVNSINAGRLQALGCKQFEWLHSGGSNQPRPLHKNVLNGKIYSFDDLPVIDERTQERGIPGQAINCHCVMRPVFTFNNDDEQDNGTGSGN